MLFSQYADHDQLNRRHVHSQVHAQIQPHQNILQITHHGFIIVNIYKLFIMKRYRNIFMFYSGGYMTAIEQNNLNNIQNSKIWMTSRI